MRAIILVGGEGTRLRPLTYGTPKQMLPVVETPLIERVVGQLVAHGVTDVILSLGYRPDAFLAGYPDSRCAGATLTYIVESEPLDTAGAIRFAASQSGTESTFLVLNGDVLTDLDLEGLIAFHRASGAEATISLTPVEDPSAFGVVPTDADGRVEAFIEKPAPGTAPTNLINAGTYVLEPSVMARIPGGRRVNIERETFPALVEEGRLYALAGDGYWLDVGTPERYLAANLDLLNGRRAGPPVRGARHEAGGWIVGAPTIDAPFSGSFVGDAARIAEGATVSNSVVGKGAVVGPGAQIHGSVLLPGARVEHGAEVSDSIIGADALVCSEASLTGWSVVGSGATVGSGEHHEGARIPT
jgi:mannose-1-phosphate guanylyltransferase